MTLDIERVIEDVGAAAAAPPLPRGRKDEPGADPKWRIGDLLVGLSTEERDFVAKKAGLSKSNARTYAETSEAFPPDTRTARASWTAHRELRKDVDRLQKIRDGMTMRDAALAAGRKAFDQKADHLQDPDQRVARIAQGLLNDGLLDRFVDYVANMKRTRAARKAVATARELRAEHRRLRELIRQAREAKFPLETALTALLQVNEMRQLLAGIGVINREFFSEVPAERWRELVRDIQLFVNEGETVMEDIEDCLDGGEYSDTLPDGVIDAQATERRRPLELERGEPGDAGGAHEK